MTYTIYALSDPRDDSIRYVGMTGSPLHKRVRLHVTQARQGKPAMTRKVLWLLELDDLGMCPSSQILDTHDDGLTSARLEMQWMRRLLSEGHPLLNDHELRSA